jgi:hypothetical protein
MADRIPDVFTRVSGDVDLAPSSPEELVHARRYQSAIWGFICLGFVLRLIAYLSNYPLWWDEAFVAVNLLRRDFLALTLPLDYGQVCPILFLWGELVSVRALGFSEWSLRLIPLLSALISLFLFRFASGQIAQGRAQLLAVAIFAVAVHPIRHAADVKPYASDLLVALTLQTLAIAWVRHRERVLRLWALVAFVPFSLMLSHPSVFVVGGIAVALTLEVIVTRKWSVTLAFLAYGFVAIASYALLYALVTRGQATSASPGMRQMWSHSFPPLDSIFGFLRWLVVAHTGDMLAYPCGGEHGGSSFGLLACVVGSVVLWRARRRAALACLLAPLGLAMLAAALRLYPYGGPAPHGSSARIMQYAAPAFCLLIGLGASRMLDLIPSLATRDRLLRIGCLGLVAVGVVPLVGSFQRPYRAYQAEAARNFARRFWPEIGRGSEVACLRWDYQAADWDSIQLGIAVSLCNQAIYSPSRKNGGPRWNAVSEDRPLRCVLGVAPETDGPRILAWLESMKRNYELRRREEFFLNTSQTGGKLDRERYEVFEFIPRRSAIAARSFTRSTDDTTPGFGSRPSSSVR